MNYKAIKQHEENKKFRAEEMKENIKAAGAIAKKKAIELALDKKKK